MSTGLAFLLGAAAASAVIVLISCVIAYRLDRGRRPRPEDRRPPPD